MLWRRANTRNVIFVISLQWKFDSYQLVSYLIFSFCCAILYRTFKMTNSLCWFFNYKGEWWLYTSFRICFLTITSSTRKETTVVGKLTSYESKQNRVPPDVKEGREIGCRREQQAPQSAIGKGTPWACVDWIPERKQKLDLSVLTSRERNVGRETID